MGVLGRIKSAIEQDWPQIYALTLGPRDAIALRRGEAELRLLHALVKPGRTALDIGANNGLYTYALLKLPTPKILAFEPNPRMIDVLRRRFGARLRDGRLTLSSTALSNEHGRAEMFIPEGAHALASLEPRLAENQERFSVEIAPLDSLDLTDVGFIKIDVEGHEGAVLEGGRALITRERPNILVEAEERHQAGAVNRARAVLEPIGYRGFFLIDGALTPVSTFDPAIHQDSASLDPTGRHKLPGALYVNNFMFVSDEAAEQRLRAALAA